MKILFLTRVHPPIVGGLENQSYNLVNNFKEINKETYVIANTHGKKFLPFFIPYSFFKSLFLIYKNNINYLHLSDGLMAYEGLWIKRITGIKSIITIHGLDITYQNWFYQKIIPSSINKLDKVICISNHTKEECIKKGISNNKITVIPNGVNTQEFFINKPKNILKKQLEKKLNISLENKIILLTVGRLVKRKGIDWFINNVMPSLYNKYIYLISGDGKEREEIKNSIFKKNLQNNVFLLGKTDFETLKLLYNASDLFIMPNITVKGDTEGFGIVLIEAGSCGLPVIASNIEGIKDAVINGKTGWLIAERNTSEFINTIKKKPLSKDKVREEVINNFDWEKIARRYLEVMR